MNATGQALERLQQWYLVQCDGRWEHERVIRIETLDNPGWTVSADLRGTPLAGRRLPRRHVDRGEHDRIEAWTAKGVFHAVCGPLDLGEALALFHTWAEEPADCPATADGTGSAPTGPRRPGHADRGRAGSRVGRRRVRGAERGRASFRHLRHWMHHA